MLALRTIGEDAHLKPVFRMATDIALYPAFILLNMSPHKSHILATCGLLEELQREVSACILILGNYQKTRCLLVDAVHESESRIVHILHLRIILEMIGQGIDQGAMIIAATRVNHQTCRLVDHEQVIVLIDDVERNIFGQDFKHMTRSIHHHRHHITRLYLVAALLWLAIDMDISVVGCTLNTVARCSHYPINEELIDTYWSLPSVGNKAEMLVEPIGSRLTLALLLYVRRLEREQLFIVD